MKDNVKETNHSRGIWAEEQAELYLKKAAYKILHSRYKTKFGEIDIITKKGNLICFVEVKVRKTISEALEAITKHSRKRIENSALFFISDNTEFMSCDMRFDVVVISSYDNNSKDFDIMHLDNAWEAGS